MVSDGGRQAAIFLFHKIHFSDTIGYIAIHRRNIVGYRRTISAEKSVEKICEKNTPALQIAARSLIAAAGLVFCGIGTYMTIQANIGVAPWDCFYLGMEETFGFRYGNVSVATSFAVIALDVLMREKIGIGTLLDAVLVGKVVDLCTGLELVPEQENMAAGAAVMVLGLIIIGFGQYIYMKMALCCGPRDALLVGLSRRISRVPIGIVSVMIMAAVLVLGWALGGPVGIGTIIGTFCTGPIMQGVFHIMKFRPKEIEHQDMIMTAKAIGRAAGSGEVGGR